MLIKTIPLSDVNHSIFKLDEYQFMIQNQRNYSQNILYINNMDYFQSKTYHCKTIIVRHIKNSEHDTHYRPSSDD